MNTADFKKLTVRGLKFCGYYSTRLILNTIVYLTQLVSNGVFGMHLNDLKLPDIKFSEIDKEKDSIDGNIKVPKWLKQSGLCLGYNYFRPKELLYYPIDSYDELCKTWAFIGAPGTGKSTMGENLAIDIANNTDFGLCFIDVADGDTIDTIIKNLSEHRLKDVILLDFTQKNYLPGLNLLDFDKEILEQFPHIIQAEIISFFKKRFAESIGFSSEDLLANGINIILQQNVYPKTLLTLINLFADKKFRKQIIESLEDTRLKKYWIRFEKFSESQQREITRPLLNKVGNLTNNNYLISIICQATSTINFTNVIDEGKILLIKAPKAYVGKTNIQIIIPIILSKFWFSALSRFKMPITQRKPFFLFLDEPQQYLNNEANFDEMLTEMRKYRLSLMLFFQSPEQIAIKNIINTILEVAPHLFIFQLGRSGMSMLMRELEEADEETEKLFRFLFFTLPKHHAISRIYYKTHNTNIVLKTKPKPTGISVQEFENRYQMLLDQSKLYTKPLDVIKKEIEIYDIDIDENEEMIENENSKQQNRKVDFFEQFKKEINQTRYRNR